MRPDRDTTTHSRFRYAALAAAVAVVIGLGASTPAVAAVPELTNPTFADTNGDGHPDGWGTWNPAGAATVEAVPDAGPEDGPAVSITSESGPDARLALTQRITVTPQTPRELTVTAQVKGEELSGGFSMLRVQAFDEDGVAVVPARPGPYLTGTFDWRTYESRIELPAEAVQLAVEPMLDRASGTIWFADVRIAETVDQATLTASATSAGPVHLFWELTEDDDDAHAYRVYRTEGSEAPEPSEETFVREAHALTTADTGAEPGTTYTYVVVAHAADGSVITTTPPATTTTPETFEREQVISTLTALETEDGARVAWSLPDDASAEGLALATENGRESVSGQQGAVVVDAAPGERVRLLAGDSEIATATVGAAEHPRSISEDAIDRVRAHLDAEQPTVTGAWNNLMTRLDAGDDGPYNRPDGSAGLYRGRDAAFAYLVTGDEQWAQVAFDAVMSAADFVVARDVNMGLELGRANLSLAPVYDWAYNGWDTDQRAQVRNLMTRSVDLLSTYHHDALFDTEKTSNWVGVTRAPELQVLLAARGDGDFGMYDDRIAYVTDQVAQHLDQGYTDHGYTQEGWDYLHYTGLYMLPSIYFAQSAGLQVLDAHVERPQWWNLALHVASSRPDGDVAQFGVSGPNGQVSGLFPLLFPLTPEGALPGLRHTYDHVQGTEHPRPQFDHLHSMWTMLYYPTEVSSDPAQISAPEAFTAILDDEPGFYAFRSGYADTSDAIIATSNRNTQHRGWSAAETFSLSWMGHGTTWATLGARAATEPNLWSKPLVDGELEPYRNQYETLTGDGVTLESVGYADQGGGYLHLDGSGNFGVNLAERQQVVDLAPGHDADAIVVIRDRFADDQSRTWDWQLRPEQGVRIETATDPGSGSPDFTFNDDEGAALSGFVLGPDAPDIVIDDGTLRISTEGESADFRIVLATSASGQLSLTDADDGTVVLDGRVIDFDTLDTGTALPTEDSDDGATSAPGVGVLGTTQGRAHGLRDGYFDVSVNMWWGENAGTFRLYENDELIATESLEMDSPNAQNAEVRIQGRPNGDYIYTGELENSAGTTATRPVTVTVRDAEPGVPQLSHDNWSRSPAFTVDLNMWWGTNATEYVLYEDDAEIARGALEANTPQAQQVQIAVTDRDPGTYSYRAELINEFGSTTGRTITVRVDS
ncbi:hypothetical protein [Pseudactinotalea sp. Z1732]|uniref:hypothetical protein n=2 Tax=Micrococcales TaxID=85006 RepID=UPI003C7EA471